MIAVLGGLYGASSAHALLVDVPYFASYICTDFVNSCTQTPRLNGDASLVGIGIGGGAPAALRLTPDAPSTAGSAFVPVSIPSDARTLQFATQFRFRIHGVNGGGTQGSDGFAFVMQSDSRAANALGFDGGRLGYGEEPSQPSTPAISPSVVVEFDTHRNVWDRDDNHIAIHLDGDATLAQQHAAVPFLLNSGDPLFAWIDYSSSSESLSVFLGEEDVKPSMPTLEQSISLSRMLDVGQFVGFTGATGGGFNNHDIERWTWTISGLSTIRVPTPQSTLLVMLGLALLVCARRGSVKW